MAKDKPIPYQPWLPEPYEVHEGYALQAMQDGRATAPQQQQVLKWIINNLCRTYDNQYFPDSTRNTDFALGKRWVGQQLVKLLNIKLGLIKKDDQNERPS